MDAVALGRSLLAGVLARKITATRRPLVAIGAVTSLVLLVLAVVFDGGWRWLAAVLFVAALVATLATFVVGTMALVLVRRVVSTEQRDLSDAGDAVDRAVEELDLPTGPVSALRLLWRLRKGVGEEVDRVTEIGQELIERLD